MDNNRFIESSIENISEPVAIFMGISSKRNPREELTDQEINLLVSSFEAYGIKTARFDAESAKDPSNLVVSKSGIQSPFIPLDEFPSTVEFISSIIENTQQPDMNDELRPHGFGHPVTINQMMEPAKENPNEQFSLVANIRAHPDPDKAEDILDKRGRDFIEDMLNKSAYLPDATLNNENCFYNGSSFPQEFLIAPKTESRAVTYGCEACDIALDYSTTGNKYGFIKEYERTSDRFDGYMDFGIENGSSSVSAGAYEHPLYPGNCRLKNVILHLDQDGKHLFKTLPRQDPEWQDFMELHRPAYVADNIMLNRRKNQKNSVNDGQAQTYSIISQAEEYNRLKSLAEQRGVSIEIAKKGLQQSQTSTLTADKPEHSAAPTEHKKDSSKRKLARHIAKLRGIVKQVSKAVKKTTLDLTKINNNGKEL